MIFFHSSLSDNWSRALVKMVVAQIACRERPLHQDRPSEEVRHNASRKSKRPIAGLCDFRTKLHFSESEALNSRSARFCVPVAELLGLHLCYPADSSPPEQMCRFEPLGSIILLVHEVADVIRGRRIEERRVSMRNRGSSGLRNNVRSRPLPPQQCCTKSSYPLREIHRPSCELTTRKRAISPESLLRSVSCSPQPGT